MLVAVPYILKGMGVVSKQASDPPGRGKDLDTSLDLNPQLSLALGHSSTFRQKGNKGLLTTSIGKGQLYHVSVILRDLDLFEPQTV